MTKTLDFNKVKKQYLTINFADEDNTVIMISTPTKSVLEELLLLQTNLEAIENNQSDTQAIDDLYYTCAKVMSRNKCNVKITKEFLEDIFDLEDVLIFFNAYMQFINDITNVKN
jgi:hypothetical protein